MQAQAGKQAVPHADSAASSLHAQAATLAVMPSGRSAYWPLLTAGAYRIRGQAAGHRHDNGFIPAGDSAPPACTGAARDAPPDRGGQRLLPVIYAQAARA